MIKRNDNHRPSIRTRIFISMLALCLVLIVFIWAFEALLLRSVYEIVKTSSSERLAKEISHNVERDDLEGFLEGLGNEYRHDIAIAVFDIDGVPKDIFISDPSIVSDGYFENDARLNEWRALAMESEDLTYKTKLDSELIYVMLAGSGNEGAPTHLIVLNASIDPPPITKMAFNTLLIFMLIFAILISVLMSFVIARNISAPISSMGKKAKSLSLYDYDVKFDEKGPREIEELASALNTAVSELKKLDTTQKELIANISHDLRTPLTLISGYSEVMRDFPEENTPENMQVIIDETARLNSLVNDLLTVSKLQSGAHTIEPKTISLTKAISDTVKRYEKLLEHKEYNIVFEKAGEEIFVNADETRLLQVIYNLINNAINYTGDDKLITVREELLDDVVRVSVIDTGEGISEEDLPLIWDRYYKVDKVHKRAVLGTGLGLSIVKSILLLHGSRFGVSSELGKGSTFWFEFKIQRKEDI